MTVLFNGFVLPNSANDSARVISQSDAFLASLRSCVAWHARSRRLATILGVDQVQIHTLEPNNNNTAIIVDIGDDDDDHDDDVDDANGDDDIESAAWSGDASLLIVLSKRRLRIFDTSLIATKSLYFHASDVVWFDLPTPCGVADPCHCLLDSADVRDESTLSWSSGAVIAVAGADGLQLFHWCTRRRQFSGRYVIVHEFLNIARVCVSRDASLLAVISVIGHVGVWRLAGDVGVQRGDNFWFHLVPDCERLIDAAFDDAGAMLGVTSWDGSLRVFERVASADEFCNSWHPIIPDYLTYVDVKHRAGQIAAPLIALLGNGTALLSNDATLVKVDVRSAAPLAVYGFERAVRGLAVCDDGQTILCATADGRVYSVHQ